MTYTITPAVTKNEQRVTFLKHATLAEIQRGAGLAGALHARSIRYPIGWVMSPSRMERWKLLFDAGYEPFLSTFGVVRFRRNDGESKRMAYAVSEARAALQLEAVE